MTKLVVLDRDGVINRDSKEFIKSPDEWVAIDGSVGAIVRLARAGYEVAVASNQSGIGRGLFDEETLGAIHDKMRASVVAAGGSLGHIAYCPHAPDGDCDCRKPRPGLFHQIAAYYGVTLGGVPAVGDSLRDLQAAVAAGAKPILVRTGNGKSTERSLGEAGISAPVFDSLSSFVDSFLAGS